MDTIEEVDREEASGPFFPMRTAGSYTTGGSYFDRDGASHSRRVNGVGGGSGGGGVGNDEEEDSSGGSVGMVVGCPDDRTDDSTMRLKAVSARLSQLMIMGNGSNGGAGGGGGGSMGSLASSRLTLVMQLDGDRGSGGSNGAEEEGSGGHGNEEEKEEEEEGGSSSRDALLVPPQSSLSQRAQTAGSLARAGSCPH